LRIKSAPGLWSLSLCSLLLCALYRLLLVICLTPPWQLAAGSALYTRGPEGRLLPFVRSSCLARACHLLLLGTYYRYPLPTTHCMLHSHMLHGHPLPTACCYLLGTWHMLHGHLLLTCLALVPWHCLYLSITVYGYTAYLYSIYYSL
jgi:hypothetical protein